jgi:hypothetical protein
MRVGWRARRRRRREIANRSAGDDDDCLTSADSDAAGESSATHGGTDSRDRGRPGECERRWRVWTGEVKAAGRRMAAIAHLWPRPHRRLVHLCQGQVPGASDGARWPQVRKRADSILAMARVEDMLGFPVVRRADLLCEAVTSGRVFVEVLVRGSVIVVVDCLARGSDEPIGSTGVTCHRPGAASDRGQVKRL